ncbi:hypothetical protein SVXHr_2876 [Halorhabdus sp. SVX81]|nr:hypothetical protein SVXHr_2876 [Halorhabdus sp. SVX81]
MKKIFVTVEMNDLYEVSQRHGDLEPRWPDRGHLYTRHRVLLRGGAAVGGPWPNMIVVGLLAIPIVLYFLWPTLDRRLTRFRTRQDAE